LKRIGAIILSSVRKADICIRYGGDEFIILIPQSGTRAAKILATHIRKKIEAEIFNHGEHTFSTSVSIGGCKWTKKFNSSAEMLEEADKCLYQAKLSGGNNSSIKR
jgi:diguanylate cyclase (GGDEF)-like protein